VGDGKSTPKTLLTTLAILREADHVAWHRPCAIWHHAIIFDVDLKQNKVEVIHYNGAPERVNGSFASVRREWVPIDLEEKNMYRMDYQPMDCHSSELVMAKACLRLNEAKYNPFTHNCEHFARWCKTGHERCVQIERIPTRMKKATGKLVDKIQSQQWYKTVSDTIPSIPYMNKVSDAGAYVVDETSAISRKVSDIGGSLHQMKVSNLKESMSSMTNRLKPKSPS
jgi:hypothetical protein